MINKINSVLHDIQNFMKKHFEREVYVEPTYYNLVINDHITRKNKIVRFNYIKSAMDYVYELDLMNNPTVDVQIIQVNHDGKNHVLRVTNASYVPQEA
jgi:hypothetical protein